MKNVVILIDGRGDYLTGLSWRLDKEAELRGGDRKNAIRYTPSQARRLVRELAKASGSTYSIEHADS